ncbi:Similar to Ctl1: Choline transporter-like 1 (Anopheles gambiae) [Cotesia congregata]|uniref:Choline transporter-like protein n=1 Tax=Cotesia congregata TaxID=51543 RepID=A0A8J2HMD8_COTCN|nr:Similar to Ctl1: Choline transporter-like 1 (Anopheles gambiae) [Cotesia congregata]
MCCDGDDEDEQQPEHPRVRGCTDIFWLCLFISFWFLMIMIAAFALVYGNPMRLVHGYDSFGNTCGTKNTPAIKRSDLYALDNSDKPLLFFFDMNDLKQSFKICVKQCPNRLMVNIDNICQFYKDTGSQLCFDDPKFGVNACNYNNQHNLTMCPKPPIYDSTPILNRCVPKIVKDVTSGLVYNLYGLLNSWDVIEQILGDLYKTWREILFLSVLAFVLSLCTIAIFHLLATFVTWIVMVLVSGTSLLWWTYADIKKTINATNPTELLEESLRNETAFLVFSIIATVVTIVIISLVCVLRRRISFMGVLFKESAKCLAELPGLFLQPLLTFCVLLLFFTFWITIIICLATSNHPANKSIFMLNSSGSPTLINQQSDYNTVLERQTSNLTFRDISKLTLVEYVDAVWIKYMWWVYIIALIWVSEFINGCQNLVISGAVAHWYFRGKESNSSPVCSAIGKLVSYHLGSVACGSFLITLFKLPRLILMFLQQKFEKTKETSVCSQCGLKSCICCFYCLEKFIRYINHNAYTVVAIEGASFCRAAKIVFVTAVTGSIGLLVLKQDPRLHFYAAPILIICIFAFFIAHCVISLYEMIIDTLFLCICEDKNLNGENGKWRQSNLIQIGCNNMSSNGQHELAPMNQ